MKHILGLIDEASTWGRTSLLLLKSFGEKPTLIPLVYAEVYGSDLLIAGKRKQLLTFSVPFRKFHTI